MGNHNNYAKMHHNIVQFCRFDKINIIYFAYVLNYYKKVVIMNQLSIKVYEKMT